MPQPVLVLHSEYRPETYPWERQEGESARWFFRFRNYLYLGPMRSVNAAAELERKSKKEKSRTNTGPEWYNAAKRYQWQERAEAYDKEQDEQKAALLREIAMKSPFISKPFRLVQLNSLVDTLSRQLEQGRDSVTFLALTKQIQSIMHDIRDELEEWYIHPDASCDAAAFDAYKQRQKRMQELEQERQDIAEEDMLRMLAKYERIGGS
jgi:hypothetical protein